MVEALFFEGLGNLLQKFMGDWREGLLFSPILPLSLLVLWIRWAVLHEAAPLRGTYFFPR